jgi:cob(I)alamin adenosyltransferase
MKVYTKTGDKGTTALLAEPESQRSARIESYGTVDELNSHIGLIRDQEMNAHYKEILIEIQDRLLRLVPF